MFSLKVNQSEDDRSARITIGVVLIAVGIALEGTWGFVLLVFGLCPLATGLIGWCPLYAYIKMKLARGGDHNHSSFD